MNHLTYRIITVLIAAFLIVLSIDAFASDPITELRINELIHSLNEAAGDAP